MANTGFLQASTDLDYILVAIANKDLVPSKYRKYNNNVFGPAGIGFAWGNNTFGVLGINISGDQSSPTQLSNGTTWNFISGGNYHTLGLRVDNTLWAWGGNGYGQLGLSDTTSRSSPVQVGTDANWKIVAAGGYSNYSLAVRTNGTLWSWGNASNGVLGLNDASTTYSYPVQVGTNTNWSLVAGGYYNFGGAIKTDGTLWTWGRNNQGQLGQNNTTYYSSPVQVGTNTNWRTVEGGGQTTFAIKTDSTLWAWGQGGGAQLPFGDLTNRSSPVQVGTGTDWSKIAIGKRHALAIKTDGTLWAWGQNGFGQLGQNTTNSYTLSPVQIGTNTNWSLIGTASYASFGIKTDGTLWSWGANGGNYTLGLGDGTSRSSPTQVGSLTNWFFVAQNKCKQRGFAIAQ